MEVEGNTLAKPKQRQFNIFKKNIKNKKQSPSKTTIHCTIPRTSSQSSNESFETLTPSVSATSVESAEDCSKMFSIHGEGEGRVAPLESTSGEVGESDDDSNSIFRNVGDVAAEAAPSIPSNVSILSNDSHDESFYSLHHDWYGMAGADDSSDDDSCNSFGPSNNNMTGLGLQDLGRIREASEEESGHSSSEDIGSDDSSVGAVYDGAIIPNQPEAALPLDSHIGLRQRLQRMSITSSENKQAQVIFPPPPPPADTIAHTGSAQRLLTPLSPIPKYIYNKSKQAHISLKIKKELAAAKYQAYKARRKEVREKRKQERTERKSRIIVIPSNHKLKIMWDMATIALTFVSAYVGHIYIRDRSTYEYDWFVVFTNFWFFVDLLLNFFTEHRTSDGKVMKTGREVWGRYLTTWFAIDALSLFPWERMFLRPVIQKIKRRNIAEKWFFRSRAVVKVTRILKGRHFKLFGKVANRTKTYGYNSKRLLQMIIKYVPKYVLFYRNMKSVLVLKVLRQIHFAKKLYRGLTSKKKAGEDEDLGDDISDTGSIRSIDFDDQSNFGFDENDNESSNGSNIVDHLDLDRFASQDTDYESCIDENDYEFDLHFSNMPE